MGLRDLLKKKGDGDDDDDEPAITISPPQSSQQHRYEEFDQYQQQYQQQFLSSQQPQQYQQYQQQQQQQRRKTTPPRPPPPAPLQTPEFTFIRSDTLSQEVIHPPEGPVRTNSDDSRNSYLQAGGSGDGGGLASPTSPQNHRHSFGMFRKSSSRSARSSRSASVSSSIAEKGDGAVESTARRLSHRLHLSRTPSTSSHVPANLPEIVVPEGEGEGGSRSMHGSSLSLSSQASSVSNTGAVGTSAGNNKPPPANPAVESQWEKRATMLAMENERQQQRSNNSSRPGTPEERQSSRGGSRSPGNRSRSNSAVGNNGNANTDGVVSSKELDANIQEAIRLHEEGNLEQSTRMFGILADPRGYNNPLSQVLYGLALRHGWGCSPDTEAAVKYLSAAASNAAAVEEMALQAGMNKGGAAKGELVLAIFELANCFRHGWGLEKDPIAAKQYYETAANLGDTDAMNEAAWCYLEGFGCKKDKFTAAKYYRLAEQNGNKTLGNSWIWKEKYDPDKQKKK
ncbi:hypothetical protein SCUCBS95973_002167 [Sporothrix curviconia]|uniref:Protein DSF2 n=1 Tax=Sporothrix curviconia TaxID=1260050 RepID=A0ABP0B4L6_9PEZI